MAQQIQTEVIINSIDITNTSLRKWTQEETFGDFVDDCKIITTNSVYSDVVGLRPGMTLTIKRGFTTPTDQFIFDGVIDKIDKQGPNIVIYGISALGNLINKSVTYSYDGVNFPSTESKGSDIAKDLIETWGGMTASVVDTGTNLILKKFICNDTDVFTRLQVLADIYDYQIRYEPSTSIVYFEPKGVSTNSQILYIGGASSNVSNLPKWIRDNQDLVNILVVKGAVQEVQDDEYFNGDGSANQVFTLTKVPISTQVWEDVGGTLILKTPGVEDSTSGTYDYEIDKENKQILCTNNWIPASGSSNIKITYTNSIPVPVQVEDTTSIGLYGERKAEKFFSDIQTVSDAEQRGNSWLSKYANPFITVMVKPTSLIEFNAGEKVQIIDSLNNENQELVITKIKKTYPYKGDQLFLGDEEIKLAEWGKFTTERIRRLEEELQKNTDLLISIKNFPHIIQYKRRYLEIQKNSIKAGNNVMIWDHPTYGIWDSYKWGGTAFDPTETIGLIWPNQRYIENFIDDTFKNASTTANWDTTNKELVFTGSQLGVSEIVYWNNTTVSRATLNATVSSGSGNLSYEMRVDETNWETVSNGTQYVFANSGEKVEWKITSTGNATITNIQIDVTEA